MRRPRRKPGDRAQTAVIGFALMFGLLVLLLTILQATAVPVWNQGAEFDHNQQVRDDLGRLHDDLLRSAATGRVRSTAVRLGTRYPRRPFLLNPADPSGRLRTTEPGTIRLENLVAGGEAGHYWTGATRTFSTRHLRYRPDYNEYDNAPTTVYENGVLYDRYGPDRTYSLTAASLVDGRDITLVTLSGSLSASGVRSESVTVQPVSAPQQVTAVEGTGPVRIRLPTQLDEEAWTDLLADEFVGNGGHVYDNVTVAAGDPYDTVTITLEGNQSYDLRMARVRVGSGTGDLGPHYLVPASATETRVPVGSSELVTVEVRDRYNNPVSGESVDAAVDGPGAVEPVEATTDEDGHAVFRYTATDAGTATVRASFGTSPGANETATVAVQAVATESGGGDDTPPAVTAIDTNATTAADRTVQRGTVLTLSATASDYERGGSDVYRVTWQSNRTAPGGPFPMVPAGTDSEFDAVVEDVVATGVDTADWEPGWHEITVAATDGNGNTGTGTYAVRVVGANAPGQVAYADGTAAGTSGGSRFGFDIEIRGSATLQQASINTSAMPEGVRPALSEVRVDGTDARTGGGRYASDGTLQSLRDQTLSGTHSIQFRNFNARTGSSLPTGSYRYQPARPSGDYLAVELVFADGAAETLYFVPP